MEEEGVVIETYGNIAKVEVKQKGECSGCRVCSLLSSGRKIAEVENLIGAKEGQRVIIEVPSTELLKGAFTLYLLPIFLFIVGVIVGGEISPLLGLYLMKDTISCLTGVIFLLLSFFLIYRYNKRAKREGRFRPKVIKLKE